MIDAITFGQDCIYLSIDLSLNALLGFDRSSSPDEGHRFLYGEAIDAGVLLVGGPGSVRFPRLLGNFTLNLLDCSGR